MNIISILHIIFVFTLLITTLYLLTSNNPIYSVLMLVLIFIESAFILILLGVEFLAILFIIIYVGAIAILFLFVVMMLDLKNIHSNFNPYIFFTALLVFGFLYSCQFLTLFEKKFLVKGNICIFDSFSNLDVFGQSLYSFFIPCFVLAGLLLLVAMLGSIVLTLKYSSRRKNELVSRQLSRTNEFLSFFNLKS